MTARDLINELIESSFVGPNLVSIKKGAVLNGHAVAQLRPKQEVFIDGKRSRVIDVTVKNDLVDLTYVVGARSFGAEKSLILHVSDYRTPVQAVDRIEYGLESIDETLTRGMRNALKRMPQREVCSKCALSIPVYPGRYPSHCPECGEAFKREKR